MSDTRYKDRKYSIVPYSNLWLERFQIYSKKIREVFSDVKDVKDMAIEHIGSTAIPNMAGKDCIDILVIVNDLNVVENHIEKMEKAGFIYAGQFLMEGSRLFRIMENNSLLANIHFFILGHSHSEEMIRFRDYLRQNPKEAEDYSRIKQELYVKYPNDYSLYRKYKDEYVIELNKRIMNSVPNAD